MHMKTYFNLAKGYGVLTTASKDAVPNGAIFSAPVEATEDTVSFLMWEKLTFEYLRENPNACYLFFEAGGFSKGKRLIMKRIAVETNTEKIMKLKGEHYPEEEIDGKRNLHLVTFKVLEESPLVGNGN